jgi:cytochrome c oxidase subunit II
MFMKNRLLWLTIALMAVHSVWAGPITNWIQDPVTPIAQEVRSDFMMTFMLTLPFLLLPQILLALSIWKFRESRGHQAATFHENIKLEIAWTAVPALTLIMIAIPAYRTLRAMEVPPKSDLVVEVVGHQFFWEYRYPRFNVAFASQPLVVPSDRVVTLNCTSVDVIHSFWVPAFGIKQDANPGRMTHTWFKAKPGKYKGQCAELCGTLHAQMLIDVTVLPPDQFDAWVQTQIDKNGPDAADSSGHASASASAGEKTL